MKIAHLTSVHSRYDTRIFQKMCRSLAFHDHNVTLVVADGGGDELRDGVEIVDVGASSGRLGRMTVAPGRIYDRARRTRADLYHLHDPELLPIGLKLKREGARVVFDSHEDYPSAIAYKPYIPGPVRPAVAKIAGIYERHACKRLDGVVSATPFIRDKFLRMGARTVDINNYPMPDELAFSVSTNRKSTEVCYVGSVTMTRGVREIVKALEHVRSDVRLNLAGSLPDAHWLDQLRTTSGWLHVNASGFLDRSGVRAILAKSMAGLVTLHPTPAYQMALPVKMFEYMSAGLPVIASNFPLWREIIEGNDCGLCVNPLDPSTIAAAIDQLATDPERARRMGANGRRAVLERYNWGTEERKLLDFYAMITGVSQI